MVRILVVDNYDSFVYNVVHYLAQIGAEVDVWRNDDERFSSDDWVGAYDGVLLSPDLRGHLGKALRGFPRRHDRAHL